MAVDTSTFETIVPSRFLSFNIPNPTLPSQLLRVAVLDSPSPPPTTPPKLAALFVPENRESDWIFTTEPGHLQLLLSTPEVSRLILIGKDPVQVPDSSVTYYNRDQETPYLKNLLSTLKLLLPALSPRVCLKDGVSDVSIVDYEDNVVSSVVLDRYFGVFVGEMLVEDVEIEIDGGIREFRRRLRFQRMPLLVQTEIRLVPELGFGSDSVKLVDAGLKPDLGVLVHPYFVPMVAGLSLISGCLEDRIRSGFRPKALCLGVGGGALLSFLKTQLGFEVLGVEMDEEVVRVARKYFGLNDAEIPVCVGDALRFIEELTGRGSFIDLDAKGVEKDYSSNHANIFGNKFDVIMVDLDSSDPTSGMAPPLEFIHRRVLLAAKSVLYDHGILVVNVIPPSRSFYHTIINGFQEFFHELYEIDVGNEENFVLIAKVLLTLTNFCDGKNFLEKLRTAISGKFLDSLKKI